ncbi:MAG: hypothetical protein ABI691_10950 [Ginsengibacter sp.]
MFATSTTRGYSAALYDHSMQVEYSFLILDNLSEQADVDAAVKILKMKPLPDSAFITNDFVDGVCMRTLKEHKIDVPRHISVVALLNQSSQRKNVQ